MTIFNVSSASELTSAIASATGGDRIVVADGNYGRLSISGRNYDSTVTIVAANPGTGAHFDGLSIGGSKNLSLVGFDVGRALNAGEPNYTQLNAIGTSTNVKLSQMTFHGSLDGNPTNDGVGLMVTNNIGFSVSDSSFSDLHRGIVLSTCTNTTIQDNDITRMQSDGIISIANDGLSIQGNHISEFQPQLGDHADAIQFWNTGQTKGQSNITIKDNVMFQTYFSGVDSTGVQGIFISDPLTYGYKNVLIQNNVLYSNDAYHGIFVMGATGLQVLDNTVVSNPTGMQFWIDVLNSTDVSVQNNVTDRILTSNLTNYFQSGNTDFLANPAARAMLPNLVDPTSPEDLITAGVGYQLPVAGPTAIDHLPVPPVVDDPLPIEINGTAGNDVLNGGAVGNTSNGSMDTYLIHGHEGDDVLAGGAGSDVLDGGAGIDQAVYSGFFRHYDIDVSADEVHVSGGSEGSDSLTGIEYIQFRDGTFVVDADSTGAQVARLYDTMFDRAPDKLGFHFHLDQMENHGMSLVAVANEFAASPEFQQAGGGLNDNQFVDYVYQHGLGRHADAAGAAFYTQALENGSMTRSEFVVSVSESAEHRSLTSDLVAHGYFNADRNYEAVSLLYDSFMGRLPDAGGLSYYGEGLKSGTIDMSQVIKDFAGSAEFHAATDGLSNAELVDQIFTNTLGRPADADGRAYYIDRLDHGMTAAAFVHDVAFSPEHQALFSNMVVDGMQLG